jgi:hypothetical protein
MRGIKRRDLSPGAVGMAELSEIEETIRRLNEIVARLVRTSTTPAIQFRSATANSLRDLSRQDLLPRYDKTSPPMSR